jgi:lincosamide nucleotidyltransferase A/C/D/E
MSEARALEVVSRLEAAGVPVWVTGGWGVDALVGRQTRRHGDLDVIVDGAHEQRALATLTALGYSRITAWPSPDPLVPKRVVAYDPLGRSVDVHPVDLGGWLTTVVAERLAHEADPAAAAFAEGRIGQRRVRCVSAALQLAAHEGYDRRDADHHDLYVLRRAGPPVPAPQPRPR